ncbi:hypothetical protein FRC0129_00005 [Corynebacterium diphtheriae]|nr:hypothetical protein CIP107549_00005 [Corynebacterium diphtheriae]CAB0728302.1 hypothetical protein FRC0129_00005 [Corynebacterium diphtheriae]
MTNHITLGGDVASALTHFASYGAAFIARDLTNSPVFTRWTNENTPRVVLTSDIATEALALNIKKIASNWAEGWTSARVKYAGGTFSPFSPRFKAIDPVKNAGDWVVHQQTRQKLIDQLRNDKDFLALQFITGLGEAAYWRFDKKSPRPDHGASRWEMVSRTKGKEFISDRLAPMCKELATWEVSWISEGIQGFQIRDTIAPNPSESRTSTGLTPPGPNDVALSFLGLLGLSQFPTLPLVSGISVTAGAYPVSVLHPQVAALPVFNQSLTLESIHAIINSLEWFMVTKEICSNAVTSNSAEETNKSARKYLVQRGVPAAARFTIRKSGSSMAPERNLERGELVLL